MFYYIIVSSAWVVCTLLSFLFGNKKLPISIGAIGIIIQIGFWTMGWGYLAITVLALLTVVCMLLTPEIRERYI